MAENGTTKKPAKGKAKAQESGVLGALPATRPYAARPSLPRGVGDPVDDRRETEAEGRAKAARRRSARRPPPRRRRPRPRAAAGGRRTSPTRRRARPKPVRAASAQPRRARGASPAAQRAPAPAEAAERHRARRRPSCRPPVSSAGIGLTDRRSDPQARRREASRSPKRSGRLNASVPGKLPGAEPPASLEHRRTGDPLGHACAPGANGR